MLRLIFWGLFAVYAVYVVLTDDQPLYPIGAMVVGFLVSGMWTLLQNQRNGNRP